MEWHMHVNDCVITRGYDDYERTGYYKVIGEDDERKFFCRNNWSKSLQAAIDFANKPNKEISDWYIHE